MLSNLYKKKWNLGLKMENIEKHNKNNEESLKQLVHLTKNYNNWINDEIKKTKEELIVSTVGK
jgi:hypothetical protein